MKATKHIWRRVTAGTKIASTEHVRCGGHETASRCVDILPTEYIRSCDGSVAIIHPAKYVRNTNQ